MQVKVNHKHGKEKATELAKNFLTKLKAQYGDNVTDLHENWNGSNGSYSCNFNGLNLSAQITVNDDEVVVDGKVPFFALPFSGMIENAIKDSMEKAMKAE